MTTPLRLAESPLAHYLPWWWLGDGVLVNHDGALSIAYELTGVDVACEPDERINDITHHLRALLNSLPVGVHLQFLRHAHTAEADRFAPYLAAAEAQHLILQEQRQRAAEHFRALRLRQFDTYLFLTRPRALGRLGSPFSTRLTRLFDRAVGARDPASLVRADHDRAVRELRQTGDAVTRYLASADVRAAPADDALLARLAYSILNPTRSKAAVPALVDELPSELPEGQKHLYRPLSLREQLVHSGLSWDVDLLYLDDPMRPHRVMALKQLPRRSIASLVRAAHRIPFDHWLSVGLGVPDSEAAYTSLEERRKRANVYAAGHVRNIRADEQLQELEAAQKQMVSRDQRVFHLSTHLLFGADTLTELDSRTREAIDVCRSHMNGAVLHTEVNAQLPAFLGLLPGNTHQAPRKKPVFTDNAADFLPVYASWPGDRRPLFMAQTRTGEPIQLDIADPTRDNWNSTVFGQSGGGKTFLVLSLTTSSILPVGSPLIVIDVGGGQLGSYYRLVQMMGGDFVDLSLDGANAINPFCSRADLFTTDEGAPAEAPNGVKLMFLTGILRILIQDPGTPDLTTVQESILQRGILAAYDRLGDSRPPLLGDVTAELEQLPLEREDRADARRFAKTLRAWIEGPHGRLLNQQSRVTLRSPFVVFDVKGIENAGRLADVVISIVSAYVWNMIARPRGNALAWVIYDECWKFLQNPTAAALVSELFRTARKLRCGAISITQKLEDFLSSPACEAILANAPVTFLLKHRDKHDLVAQRVGLNERELDLFRGLLTEKGRFAELLYKSDRGSAVVRNAPSPMDYWVNTTEPRDRDLEGLLLAECAGDRLAALRRLMTEYPHGAIAGRKA